MPATNVGVVVMVLSRPTVKVGNAVAELPAMLVAELRYRAEETV